MDQFSFLEFADESPAATAGTSSYRLLQIPDNQYLNYLDLVSLQPATATIKRVSKRLIEKYRFIPIIHQSAQRNFRMPLHLDPQYHMQYKFTDGIVAYIALCPPANGLPLQFISNAIGYGFYGLPIKEETFQRFMQEQYP
jgi:hypothetical protein